MIRIDVLLLLLLMKSCRSSSESNCIIGVTKRRTAIRSTVPEVVRQRLVIDTRRSAPFLYTRICDWHRNEIGGRRLRRRRETGLATVSRSRPDPWLRSRRANWSLQPKNRPRKYTSTGVAGAAAAAAAATTTASIVLGFRRWIIDRVG